MLISAVPVNAGGSVADPYLSPAVRSVIEDPVPDAAITLRVTLADETRSREPPDAVSAIRTAGGSIERPLPFDALEVSIPQKRVAALVELEGIAAIETAATVSNTGDAGEDVRLDTDEEP